MTILQLVSISISGTILHVIHDYCPLGCKENKNNRENGCIKFYK